MEYRGKDGDRLRRIKRAAIGFQGVSRVSD